jgi:hypothetical protein
MTYTARDKAKEAIREVSYRQFVYSKKVDAGTMKLDDAERRIAVMQEIADDYLVLAEAEDIKGRLL